MRLTGTRLRQIIKEEISRIDEGEFRLRPKRIRPGTGDDIDMGPYDPYADDDIDLGPTDAMGNRMQDPGESIGLEMGARQRSFDKMSSAIQGKANEVKAAYQAMNPKPMGGRRIFILDSSPMESIGDEDVYAYTAQTAGVGRGDVMVKKMPGEYSSYYYRFMETGNIPANVYFFDSEMGIYKP